jgi:hypothetical protein
MSKPPSDHRAPKPARPLTRKQQAFVKHLIDNPKASATAAARASYGKPDKPVTELSARNIAHDNLTKPNVMAELAKHSGTAEIVLIEVMNQSREQMYQTDRARAVDWANTARQSANDVIDRVHGKAVQQIQQTTKAVTLNINLTDVVDPLDSV